MSIPPVQSGEPLEIRADDWNAMVSAANAHHQSRHANRIETAGRSRPTGLVRIRNHTGIALKRGDVVILGDRLAKADGVNMRGWREGTPAFKGQLPPGKRCAILLEPLPAAPGRLALAVISGTVRTKIDVTNTAHRFAQPVADSAQLVSTLRPDFGLEILWKESGTGVKHADLLMDGMRGDFLYALTPEAGIPARVGLVIKSAVCTFYEEAEPVAGEITLALTSETGRVYNPSNVEVAGSARVLTGLSNAGNRHVLVESCEPDGT